MGLLACQLHDGRDHPDLDDRATILSLADLIVPGHSAPVAIDASLTGGSLSTFPAVAHAIRCDHVRQLLSDRLEQLQADARPGDAFS